MIFIAAFYRPLRLSFHAKTDSAATENLYHPRFKRLRKWNTCDKGESERKTARLSSEIIFLNKVKYLPLLTIQDFLK